MAAHRPDSRFSIGLRTLYMGSLIRKGLKSSIMNEIEVEEVLDRLLEKYDGGLIERPKKVETG